MANPAYGYNCQVLPVASSRDIACRNAAPSVRESAVPYIPRGIRECVHSQMTKVIYRFISAVLRFSRWEVSIWIDPSEKLDELLWKPTYGCVWYR